MKHSILLLAAACLLIAFGWVAARSSSAPSSCSLPLALTASSIHTAEITLRSARYGVYLVHQAPCASIRIEHPEHVYNRYKNTVDCDLTITIHRYMADGPILLQSHTTAAKMAMSTNAEAFYDLGYFETAEDGKLVMVASNVPSRHDDSVCHARVEIRELFRM